MSDSVPIMLAKAQKIGPEVWELARKVKVSEKIIKKVPSAGLWEGQTDEGDMGITYKNLDDIIAQLDYVDVSCKCTVKGVYL